MDTGRNESILEFKDTAPDPPDEPKVSDIQTTSVTVTWEPPSHDGGSHVINYMLELRDPAVGRWHLVEDGLKGNRRVVTALKAESKYQFRVFARNGIGRGRPSNPSEECVTGKPTVPGTPEDIKISDVGTTSLTLSWQPPSSNGGTPITGYIVEHKGTHSDRWMRPQTKLVKETTFTVKGLNWMDDYHFRVVAENKAGNSPAGELLEEHRCAIGKWKRKRHFGKGGKPATILQHADGITLCHNETDVAVADTNSHEIKVYNNKNGKFKMALDTNQDLQTWQTSRPRQVKVSFLGTFFVTDSTTHVRVFDANGDYERQFVAFCPEKTPSNANRHTKLSGLALDAKGSLYVGAASSTSHSNKQYISKHTQDGSHISSFATDTEPHYIAVTPQDTIIFSGDRPSSTAQIVDQRGNLLHTLTPTAGVVDWIPKGVFCCRDTVFVSNHTFRGRSGIYCYTLAGEFIGSITEDLPSSHDLVVTEDGNGVMVTASDIVTVLERKI